MNPASAMFAIVTVILNATAQLLLRQAAMTGAAPTAPLSLLKNAWFLCGLLTYAASVLTWLLVLRRVPLTIAAPFVALVYVIVPLASRILFSDTINVRMWVGMLLVVAGVTLVARSAPTEADGPGVPDADRADR